MKNVISILGILLIFFLSSSNAMACTIIPEGFCVTNSENFDRSVLSGKIIDIDDDGINIAIINILRGVENRDTIRIWDGTDFDCNGLWSLAASRLGHVNDTIIIILPIINSLENVWDVIGDYRIPDSYYEETAHLSVRNDTIRGFINGSPWSSNYVNKIAFSDFINYWDDHTNDCIGLVATKKTVRHDLAIDVFPNPAKDYIKVSYQGRFDWSLYNIHGRMVAFDSGLFDEDEINVAFYTKGIYLLKVKIGDHFQVKRIVIQ